MASPLLAGEGQPPVFFQENPFTPSVYRVLSRIIRGRGSSLRLSVAVPVLDVDTIQFPYFPEVSCLLPGDGPGKRKGWRVVTSAVVETSSDHLGSQKRLPERGRAAASFFPGKWQQHPIWPCMLTAPHPFHCLSRASLLCQGFLLS